MARKKTASAEPITTAIAPAETAIVPVDSGIMAIADDHTSTKLITDQEAMERLGQAVDIAVQRAEDAIPAAGINLLQGTRDFNLGTVRMPDTLDSPPRYINGFTNSGGFTFYNDKDYFTVATKTRTQGEASRVLDDLLDNPKLGHIYTLSFEYMVENSSTIPPTPAIIYVIKKSDNAILYTKAIGKQYAINEIENGKWVKFVCSTTIPSTITDECFLIARCNFSDGNGTVHYKKLMLNEGDIANPTWSANPFDVVQTNLPLVKSIQTSSTTSEVLQVGTALNLKSTISTDYDLSQYIIASVRVSGGTNRVVPINWYTGTNELNVSVRNVSDAAMASGTTINFVWTLIKRTLS